MMKDGNMLERMFQWGLLCPALVIIPADLCLGFLRGAMGSYFCSLAKQAGLQPTAFQSLSKPRLFQKLKDQWNFERLQRAQSRSVKRKTDERDLAANQGSAWLHGRRKTSNRKQAGSASSASSAAAQPKKRQKLNTIDPILLTEIGRHKVRYPLTFVGDCLTHGPD